MSNNRTTHLKPGILSNSWFSCYSIFLASSVLHFNLPSRITAKQMLRSIPCLFSSVLHFNLPSMITANQLLRVILAEYIYRNRYPTTALFTTQQINRKPEHPCNVPVGVVVYRCNTCALSRHIGNMCMRLRNGGIGEASPTLFPRIA
jgi:hypothetical protein